MTTSATSASTLSPTTQAILETVRDWGVIDREQLTALSAHDGLSPDGVRTALGRLVTRRFLSRDVRIAHHPKAQLGLARKRIVYYLAQEGRTYFGFETKQREKLTAKIKRLTYYPERLPHAVGV